MVKSNSSFTLIEIIVVTAIIAVVTSMGFANFHRQQSDQQLKAETRKMADMIGLARKKAMITDITQCNDNNDRIENYIFKIQPLTKSYEFFPTCVNSIPKKVTYTIQSNEITIRFPASETPVYFYPRLLEETTPITIELKNNTTPNRCCKIDINSAGVIKEIPCAKCDP